MGQVRSGMVKARAQQTSWWTNAIIYQIYPRSFHDSNGDGVGDLFGIKDKLDYLKTLGIDAIWLSPFFKSPMQDFGYDVSDYCEVDPIFGDLDAFDALLARANELGLKVIIDFVPNHTSEHHAWFREARSSRQSAKRDWYLWRDPASDGGLPNNWLSVTGGPAWTLDPKTNQYYLHSFLPFQPDLNWRNPEVQKAVFNALRFWLDRGVHGIRVDMVDFMIKDAAFRDEQNPAYTFDTSTRHINQPELLDLLRDLRSAVEEYDDRVIIGEIFPGTPLDRLKSYYGDDDRMHLPFNFRLLDTEFSAPALFKEVGEYYEAIKNVGSPNFTLGNHDTVRLASRFGSENVSLAAILLLTLPGSIFLYQGDELGLPQAAIPPHMVQDPWELREPGRGRDGTRTPMPWTTDDDFGFGSSSPWLPIPVAHKELAVSTQQADNGSTWSLYQRLITLRCEEPALSEGTFRLLDPHPQVLVYQRTIGGHAIIVVLNLSDASVLVEESAFEGAQVQLVTTREGFELNRRSVSLPPNEGVILKRFDAT